MTKKIAWILVKKISVFCFYYFPLYQYKVADLTPLFNRSFLSIVATISEQPSVPRAASNNKNYLKLLNNAQRAATTTIRLTLKSSHSWFCTCDVFVEFWLQAHRGDIPATPWLRQARTTPVQGWTLQTQGYQKIAHTRRARLKTRIFQQMNCRWNRRAAAAGWAAHFVDGERPLWEYWTQNRRRAVSSGKVVRANVPSNILTYACTNFRSFLVPCCPFLWRCCKPNGWKFKVRCPHCNKTSLNFHSDSQYTLLLTDESN